MWNWFITFIHSFFCCCCRRNKFFDYTAQSPQNLIDCLLDKWMEKLFMVFLVLITQNKYGKPTTITIRWVIINFSFDSHSNNLITIQIMYLYYFEKKNKKKTKKIKPKLNYIGTMVIFHSWNWIEFVYAPCESRKPATTQKKN